MKAVKKIQFMVLTEGPIAFFDACPVRGGARKGPQKKDFAMAEVRVLPFKMNAA